MKHQQLRLIGISSVSCLRCFVVGWLFISFKAPKKKGGKNMEKKKYEFRKYRLSEYHPFLVAVITEAKDEKGKIFLSGFNLTHSINAVLSKPNKFIRITNPNPEDDAPCYLCVDAIKDKPIKYFTKPLQNWELSEDDIPEIEELIERKIK